jgi:spermidine synthase
VFVACSTRSRLASDHDPMTFDADPIHIKPFICETRKTRSLHFSIAEVQSCMDLARPDSLDLEYTRTMMGFLLFHPMPLRIGMIGLGGGSLAKFCYRHLPSTDITVLAINPHVVALRDDFSVPRDDERFRVVCADGARYVRSHKEAFDVLLVDGYDYDGLPNALSSGRFYDDAFGCLRPSGVVVANLHLRNPEFAAIVDRIARSFESVPLSVVEGNKGNAIVFARRDCTLSSCALETPVRPKSLEPSQWKRMQAAFSRVRAAMAQQAP